MTRLLAVFDDITKLPELPEDSETFSAEPHHPAHFENSLLSSAIIGGIVGGIAGLGLAVFTFRAMHLQTGHMTGSSFPPTGIVIFALTALFSITAVVAVLLRSTNLPARTVLPADVRAKLMEGAIAVVIDDASKDVEKSMQAAGASTQWLA